MEMADGIITFCQSDMFTRNRLMKAFLLSDGQTSGESLHTHDYIQIWYILRGACEHWVDMRLHRLTCGDAFFVPPGMPHKTLLATNTQIICCEFSPAIFETGLFNAEKVEAILADLPFFQTFLPGSRRFPPKYTFPIRLQSKAEFLMLSILDEYSDEKPYCGEMIQTYILQLVLLFAHAYAKESCPEPISQRYAPYVGPVKASIQYIERHYAEALALEDICRRAGVSRSYYCMLFKVLTGHTFVEYLARLRIRHAQAWLRQPGLPITEIASRVGYQDGSHFARTFHKFVGLSPRAYRAQHME